MKNKREQIILCPADKEYKMLIFYDKNIPFNRVITPFDLMNHALINGSWTLIDLDVLSDAIEQDFIYLKLLKRYTQYKLWALNNLSYNETGFHLENFTFDNLDEIETALSNKAFL